MINYFMFVIGEEHLKEDFEILRQGDFVWEFCSNGAVPEGAVVCGQTADGEALYIGRCLYQGNQKFTEDNSAD